MGISILENRYKYVASGTKITIITGIDGEEVQNKTAVTAEVIAEDAKVFVDPEAVKKALDNVNEVLKTGMEEISRNIENISVDAGGNMLSVEDATMEPIIKQVAESIKQIPGGIKSELEKILPEVEKKFNEKQKEYNAQAREKSQSECQSKGGTDIRIEEHIYISK